MRNASTEGVERVKNIHFRFNNIFSEYHVVCEMTWERVVEPDRPQMKIWRMRIAYWIRKTANTHLLFVILTAFPVQ